MPNLSPAFVNNNSPLLPVNPYVNIPATNGRLPTNTSNAFIRSGCGGLNNILSVPNGSINNLTPLEAAINIPFSQNNKFMQNGGYRYKKSIKSIYNRAKGIKFSKRRKKHKKKTIKLLKKKYKTTKRHQRYRRHGSHQKGGTLLRLGSSPVNQSQMIPTSTKLSNIPYSQGYTINEKNSTDYGALSQPIPINSYAKCPPKIRFN